MKIYTRNDTVIATKEQIKIIGEMKGEASPVVQ